MHLRDVYVPKFSKLFSFWRTIWYTMPLFMILSMTVQPLLQTQQQVVANSQTWPRDLD